MFFLYCYMGVALVTTNLTQEAQVLANIFFPCVIRLCCPDTIELRILSSHKSVARGWVDYNAEMAMDKSHAMQWNPPSEDDHRVDRRYGTWRRTVDEDCERLGKSWSISMNQKRRHSPYYFFRFFDLWQRYFENIKWKFPLIKKSLYQPLPVFGTYPTYRRTISFTVYLSAQNSNLSNTVSEKSACGI